MSDSLLGEVLQIGEDVASKNYAGALSELEAAGLAYFEAQPLYTLAVDASIKIRAFNHTFGSITFVKKTFQIPLPPSVFALLTKIHGDTLVKEDAHGFTLVITLSPSVEVAPGTKSDPAEVGKKGYDIAPVSKAVEAKPSEEAPAKTEEVQPAPAPSFHPAGDVPSKALAEATPESSESPVGPNLRVVESDTSESGVPAAQPADLVGFQPS